MNQVRCIERKKVFNIIYILCLILIHRCTKYVGLPPQCQLITDPFNKCCKIPYCDYSKNPTPRPISKYHDYGHSQIRDAESFLLCIFICKAHVHVCNIKGKRSMFSFKVKVHELREYSNLKSTLTQ